MKSRVPLDRLPTATIQITLTRTILRKEIWVARRRLRIETAQEIEECCFICTPQLIPNLWQSRPLQERYRDEDDNKKLKKKIT